MIDESTAELSSLIKATEYIENQLEHFMPVEDIQGSVISALGRILDNKYVFNKRIDDWSYTNTSCQAESITYRFYDNNNGTCASPVIFSTKKILDNNCKLTLERISISFKIYCCNNTEEERDCVYNRTGKILFRFEPETYNYEIRAVREKLCLTENLLKICRFNKKLVTQVMKNYPEVLKYRKSLHKSMLDISDEIIKVIPKMRKPIFSIEERLRLSELKP